ncbi:hypothetical protein [Pigmentiphaga daeguensis]|uniref:Uncharacterized protein n=1 Tax=Pigmentiphaga daeguensis TaxID=414049 RepID=A0ABN1BEB6_9BURK
MARETIHTELGEELERTRCRAFWPADDEFYSRVRAGGAFKSWCKACLIAYDRDRAQRRQSTEVSR